MTGRGNGADTDERGLAAAEDDHGTLHGKQHGPTEKSLLVHGNNDSAHQPIVRKAIDEILVPGRNGNDTPTLTHAELRQRYLPPRGQGTGAAFAAR